MAHLSYKEYKERYGDNGVTEWVKFNWIYGGEAPSPLPEGYTLLDYIEGTGSQYIDPQYTYARDHDSILIDMAPYEDGTDRLFFGVYGQGLLSIGCLQGHWRGNVSEVITERLRYAKRVSVEMRSDRYWYVDNVNVTPQNPTTAEYAYNTYLFARNYATPVPAKMRVYRFTVIRDGEEYISMIPCINPDGVYGMYDVIRNQFFQSETDTPFIGA